MSKRSGRVGVARRFIDLSGEYNAHTVDRIVGGKAGLMLRSDEAASKVKSGWEAEALLSSPLLLLLATMNDRPPKMSHALHTSGH